MYDILSRIQNEFCPGPSRFKRNSFQFSLDLRNQALKDIEFDIQYRDIYIEVNNLFFHKIF